MKKFLIIAAAIISLVFAQSANATQLPPEVKNYILQNIPDATIRFDGLITLPDGTFYLPLIPAYTVKDAEFGVKFTYPKNKSNLAKRPEILIFENNYCLLKLIKNKDKTLSVADLKDFPIEVRSGILPQDLLVPKGLVLPDSLVGILGDLNVPLKSNLKITPKQEIPTAPSQTADLPKKPEKINVIPQLKDKQFYITNFNSNFIYIMPSNLRDVQYTLKLDSIPKAVREVGGNYLLVSTAQKTYIDVVDVKNEEIAKQIDIGVEPDEMVVSKDEKTAYVISNSNSNLYVIDIQTMSLTKQIQIKGNPEKLAFSEDESKLIYIDSATSDIYSVELKNHYVNIYQCTVPNTAKIILSDNKVYALSRTRNSLKIYPYQELVMEKTDDNQEILGSKREYYIKAAFLKSGPGIKTYFKKQKETQDAAIKEITGESINTATKPVDMLYRNGKIYILSSVENQIDIVNPVTQQVEKSVPLRITGFSNKFNEIKNSGLVIITNVMEKKYVVFDLDKELILQTNPIDLPITTLTIINKSAEAL